MDKIIELSEKLAELYGVEAFVYVFEKTVWLFGKEVTVKKQVWLAEDSGRISDLADDNDVCVKFYTGVFDGAQAFSKDYRYVCDENFISHPTKHDATRMARVRCLIAIKES